MKDLTKDSISHHILMLSIPVLISTSAHAAYQLVDLYFIAKISVAATAGVNAAGNTIFFVMALAQMMAAGTMPLVAHALGRQDRADATLVLNQSLLLSVIFGMGTSLLMFILIRPYLRVVTADEATLEAGTTFVLWLLPSYALSLPMAVLSAALRGAGIIMPSTIAYILTLVVNALLAPVLIAGWGTQIPLGALGAGLATSVSVAAGLVFLCIYFSQVQDHMSIEWRIPRPDLDQWSRVLSIGLPTGGESALSFLSAAVVYYVLQDLGASVQAGYGIGSRVLQALLLPALSIAIAAGPVAGQNFGAKISERVMETFRMTALFGAALMVITTTLVQFFSVELVSMFDTDSATRSVAVLFLQLASWTLVAQSFVFTCSVMFQGLGNTMPSLLSSGTRLITFSIPAVWVSSHTTFRIEQLWYLLMASSVLQVIVSSLLLRVEFSRQLRPVSNNLRVTQPGY